MKPRPFLNFVIAALLGGFFMSALAEDRTPPDDVTMHSVQIQIYCVPTMQRMMGLLLEKFSEVPVAMGMLNQNDSWLITTNRDATTSSILIAKRNKEETSVCLVWSGDSQGVPGLTFSLNPSPQFPEPEIEGFGT